MAPQSPRRSTPARPARFARLRCEQFEDRITPALFDVQAPMTFSGLNNNGCVAVADFNHDGLMDAVLTNFGSGYGTPSSPGTPGNSITILYGKQGGGFNTVTLNTGGTNPSFVSIADINGDGWADLVVSNENSQNMGTVSVFKNDGAGNLSLVGTPFQTFSNDPSWVGLADVTGDHVPDVVVGSFGKDDGTGNNITGNNVTIFQGNADAQGNGNFTYSSSPITTLTPDISFAPTALAVADFNGDGIMDIAAAVPGVPADSTSPQPDGNVYVFRGTGSGGFAAPNQYDTGGALPVNIQAADLNGDQKPDLIVANAGDPNSNPEFHNNAVGVLLNVSSGGSLNFGITNSLTANCHGTFAVAVADFNGDGKADIAAINYGSQSGTAPTAFVSVYTGNGAGTFTPGSPGTYDTQTNLGGGQYLAVGDFDGNGTPDLIVAHASNKVGLLLNTTAPSAHVTGVTVDNGAAQRSMVTTLAVTFDTTVNIAAGAFALKRVGLPNGGAGDNATVGTINVSTQTVGGVTVATLTFAGANVTAGSLADGNWTLTVDHTKVTTAVGGTPMAADYTQTGIKRLFGDANGDGHVDNADFFLFRSTFGLSTGQAGFLAAFDYDGSGTIDNADFFQFRARFGWTI
jgi:hypothetical protein